ncbi:UDP-glucoronosyl and UDP-glucosyl transferase [Trichostrongylus colubriformis]
MPHPSLDVIGGSRRNDAANVACDTVRLAAKGKNVTIYSMVHKSIGPLGTGVHSLETVLRSDQHTSDENVVDKLFWFFEMTPKVFEKPHEIGLQYLMHSLNDQTFHRIMNTKWDIVLLDEMFVTAQGAMALAFCKKYGTKLATFATTDLSGTFSIYRGFSRNPVTAPNYYTKGYDIMTHDLRSFRLRLFSVMDVIYEQYVFGIASNRWFKKAGKVLNVHSTYEILYQASHASFTDFPSRYGYTSSLGTDLINVGEHCQASRELPSDLRAFVEDPSSKGTIYIAFGSIVKWHAAKPEVISAFFDVLNSLTDYRIIFSYAGPEVKNVSEHVKILPWAPQNDILAHNKTVLFFTHGGLKSIKEGICSSTKMLFLPFFADQPRNALFARSLGIAEVIYKKNITREELSLKINRVLTDSRFDTQIRKLNRQFLDHVIEPLEYGSYWISRLEKIDNIQTMYYKNRGRLLSWISFLYIDFLVIAFMSSVLI